MFFHKTPGIIKRIYPQLQWSVPTTEKTIYLTFDDGPIPELTDFILDTLEQYHAKATFFCVGDNLVKHKKIAEQAINKGHTLGNHTFNHLNGWKTDVTNYLDSVEKCQGVLADLGQRAKLYRPPYGRITRGQIAGLKEKYLIMMWDVLSGDYSSRVSRHACLKNTIKATTNGSVVLFHDNVKAAGNLMYTLPKYLNHFSAAGYQFKSLSAISGDKENCC